MRPARAGRTHRAGPRVAPYRPGEVYPRELPPLRAVLADLDELGLLVVDGYADLDPAGRPGLGARAHGEFGIPVIGVGQVPVPHRNPRSAGGARILGPPDALRRADTLARTGPPQPP